jgi:hypothetical protein
MLDLNRYSSMVFLTPYFFILTMGRGSIYSEFYKNTQGAFSEYGVQIMLLLCRFDPARARIVPKGKRKGLEGRSLKNEKKYIHSINFFNSAILSKSGFIRLPGSWGFYQLEGRGRSHHSFL